ncbi:flavin reductase [Paraburkholderia sp. BL21I4N1]|uniref:flavin reductase n=1 Tax=Paraburkholderia sp. BL21I4N1 TaxID=1938801 RepID=UPI000D4E66DB|nr:flavin reductase [Paraburkholderia sp. BL21I4N1]PQV54825.1 flavin reductase [Paraburkholderia sp. BL21I4N1]
MIALSPDRTTFREAMARIGAAVNIITTTTTTGDVGMTVSAVCSVTDDPATVLVCIGRSSRQYHHFSTAGIICINVLSHEHEVLSPIFAGKGDIGMTERFTHGKWIRLATGAPVLESAAASLDCTVSRSVDIGTHTVFFCAVQAVHLGSSVSGLVYHGRAYHRIPQKQA